jgi:transposase
MRFEHCLNPNDSSISQGETRLWFCATEQEGEYHTSSRAFAGIGIGEAFLLEGSADTAVFELYVEQILAPSLHPGQIVIMDNLNTHTGEKVRQAIEARGCQLQFLPSYSPDLSPIEEAFSKLKAVLRRMGARTPEVLQEAIGQALLTITARDARGWFTHCGYSSDPPSSFQEGGACL